MMYFRYFVISTVNGKTKTHLSCSRMEDLNNFVEYVVKKHNAANDMVIIDWQDRKQVKLIDYYNTEVKK